MHKNLIFLVGAISLVSVLGPVAAQAQTVVRHPAKVHAGSRAYPASRIGPDTELKTSASAPVGSENHYFSDTVAASQTDLLDLDYRYGQTPTPHYNGPAPLFRF
jgi:hypothetical protein